LDARGGRALHLRQRRFSSSLTSPDAHLHFILRRYYHHAASAAAAAAAAAANSSQHVARRYVNSFLSCRKTAITSKIKYAIKLKTSPARLAQLLRCAVIGCKLKQNANDGCNSCASFAGFVLSFIACLFYL